MDVSYEHYKVFYYVAKYRSFTKAAKALYANQPNITRTVKNLENELGCTLFVRSNRAVSLTPEGEKLYAHIKIAFEHIQAAEEELFGDKSLQSGIVSVGATENALHHILLLPILKDFRRLYPGISIKVTNHSTTQALNALKNGLVDFAVVTGPVQLPKPLKAVDIKQFHEVAVASAAFASLAKREISVKELAEYPLICLGAETMTYEFYSRFFWQNGAALSPDIEVATTDQILLMVKNDLGIGFIPEYFLSDRTVGRLHVLNITPPIPERTICLVKRTDQPLSIAAKELEKMILAQK